MHTILRQSAVLFLLFAGAALSVRLHFFPLWPPFLWLRKTLASLKKGSDTAGISPLQGISTALAGTLGTGNIAGVALALATGGPGAIFWMWVSALLGCMTAFAENVLGAMYAQGPIAGPMAYLERGLHSRSLANLYALLCLLASFGIGNLCQSNAAAQAVRASFGLPCLRFGVVFALLAALVVMGGVRSIAAVSQWLVPLITGVYLAGCGCILLGKIQLLPAAFSAIFHGAFSLRAGFGGAAGWGMLQAMRTGCLRGVFSNEAGLGTTVLAHAPVGGGKPISRGMWAVFEVFTDTMLLCTVTALTILVSGVLTRQADGAALTQAAFSTVFGAAGAGCVALMLTLFAFTTVIAWCSYGIQCIRYISVRPGAVLTYKIAFVCMLIPAAVLKPTGVWETSDLLNCLLIFPNLMGVLALSGQVKQILNEEKNNVSGMKFL